MYTELIRMNIEFCVLFRYYINIYVNIYTGCTLIYIQKKRQNKFTPTAQPPLSIISIDEALFSPLPVVGRLFQKYLSRVIPFPRGLFPGGAFLPWLFFARDPFCQGIFHGQLSCHVGDCWRLRHGLIREGEFSKGASNSGAVVLGALVPGPFGKGWSL